jgi:hypothetical protein
MERVKGIEPSCLFLEKSAPKNQGFDPKSLVKTTISHHFPNLMAILHLDTQLATI